MPSGEIGLKDESRVRENYLLAAQAGDSGAFSALTEPYRGELTAHCYRMLGSIQEAEEIVQEAYLRAWRRLNTYEGRASFRAWLYKIATNACLDDLRRSRRRSLPAELAGPADPISPIPVPASEPIWIEPFPDELLTPVESGPEARYDTRESISLAFLVALQVLPPRQRAALILGEVLEWSALEIAEMLDSSVSAVNSLLHRARITLKQRGMPERWGSTESSSAEPGTQVLLERYLRAWEAADLDALVSLLTEGAAFPMPPLSAWYQGRPAIRTFLAATSLAGEARGRWRLLPIRANAQPGFAFYKFNAEDQKYQAFALQVVRIEGDLIAEAVTFGFPELFPAFNMPVELDL